MKSDSYITYKSAGNTYALVILALECPDEVLAELVNIDSISETVDEPAECYKTVLCHSLQ